MTEKERTNLFLFVVRQALLRRNNRSLKPPSEKSAIVEPPMTIINQFKKNPLWAKIALLLYAACLLAATCNHAMDIMAGGKLFPYDRLFNAPLFSNLYWSSLLLADPAAAILLVISPTIGIIATMIIIITDVIHNFIAAYTFLNLPFAKYSGLQNQLAFCIFVLITSPFLLRVQKKYNRSRPAK